MNVRSFAPLLALLLSIPAPARSQDAAEDILREQVELVLHGMIGQSIDRQLKVVGLGERDGNVAVGILHRTDAHDTDGAHDGIVHVDEIHEGDIVVIPAGTLHSWTSIPDHVTYLSIRPDPHGVLPEGYVRPEIRQ